LQRNELAHVPRPKQIGKKGGIGGYPTYVDNPKFPQASKKSITAAQSLSKSMNVTVMFENGLLTRMDLPRCDMIEQV
jgi:hypothetical protein